jgi:hypothetical protein
MDLHAQPDENLLILATTPAEGWYVAEGAGEGMWVAMLKFPNAAAANDVYQIRLAERTRRELGQQIERLRLAAGSILEDRRAVLVDEATLKALETVITDSRAGSFSPSFQTAWKFVEQLRTTLYADEKRVVAVRGRAEELVGSVR